MRIAATWQQRALIAFVALGIVAVAIVTALSDPDGEPASSGATTPPASSPSVADTPSSTPGPPVHDVVPGSGIHSTDFTPAYYEKWSNGLPADPNFFPIGVWNQDPRRERRGVPAAAGYRNAGINMFVGLWDFPDGPDSAGKLSMAKQYGLLSIAGGSLTGASGGAGHSGYQLGDEQDMSTNPVHVTPEEVVRDAEKLRKADPSRPIFNNWGKAFSIYPWIGAHEDEAGLKRYCSKVDISSSDYYASIDGYEPENMHTPVWYGKAVDNVRLLCGGQKPAWGFVETGHPDSQHSATWAPFSKNGTITPAAIEYAVWSMLAHGANGIVYFVHDFYPDHWTEDGLFDHPDNLAAVKRINTEIESVARILNAQRLPTGLSVTGADATLRRDAQGLYVVAAESAGHAGKVSFHVSVAPNAKIEVVGENRTMTADASGSWTDSFTPWDHHIYRIPSSAPAAPAAPSQDRRNFQEVAAIEGPFGRNFLEVVGILPRRSRGWGSLA